MALFVTESGGFYDLTDDGTILHVRGVRSDTTYSSPETFVEIRGKVRQHTGVGKAQLATLHLDTGEGISHIKGYYRADH